MELSVGLTKKPRQLAKPTTNNPAMTDAARKLRFRIKTTLTEADLIAHVFGEIPPEF
jgi:hypothetical protein